MADRDALKANVGRLVPSNMTGAVSALDLRTVINDVIDQLALNSVEDKFTIPDDTPSLNVVTANTPVTRDYKTLTAPAAITTGATSVANSGVRVGAAGYYNAELQITFEIQSSAGTGEWTVRLVHTNSAGTVLDQAILTEHTENGSALDEDYAETLHLTLQSFAVGDLLFAQFEWNSAQTGVFRYNLNPGTAESFIKLRRFAVGEIVPENVVRYRLPSGRLSGADVVGLLTALVGTDRLPSSAVRGLPDSAESWAEVGNTDPIPAGKLINAPSGGGGLNQAAVDARVEAGVADWAEAGNAGAIPAGKLTNSPGLNQAQVDARVNAVIPTAARVPAIDSGDANKVLKVDAGGTTADWETDETASGGSGLDQAAVDARINAVIPVARRVPTIDSSDANRVLKVNSGGNAADWETDEGGLSQAQVDARVQAGVADWAEQGNAGAIPAGKLTNAPGLNQAAVDARVNAVIPTARRVPSVASGDANKVLKVNAGGNAADWEDDEQGLNQTQVDARVNTLVPAAKRVPDIESGDANKVLKVNSGGTSADWEDAASGGLGSPTLSGTFTSTTPNRTAVTGITLPATGKYLFVGDCTAGSFSGYADMAKIGHSPTGSPCFFLPHDGTTLSIAAVWMTRSHLPPHASSGDLYLQTLLTSGGTTPDFDNGSIDFYPL